MGKREPEADDERRETSQELLRQGLAAQERGALTEAKELYRASIRACPSAEAHTFLGWVMSFSGQLEEAITECRTAIGIDPGFGNPYNDIGVYLMQLGRDDEAIPWLARATAAPRYEPRHFPHVNLARIHERHGRLGDAVSELDRALAHQPGDRSIRTRRHALLARLN